MRPKTKLAHNCSTAITVAALLLGLTACTSQAATDWDPTSATSARARAEQQGYALAVQVLSDGRVDQDEWLQMHMGWRKCMQKLGFHFEAPFIDPVNGLEYMENREYHGPGKAPDEASETACDNEYDYSVGQIYYQTVQPHMAPALISKVNSCLRSEGEATPGSETKLSDFFPAGTTPQKASKSVTMDCVRKEYYALYPTMKVIGLSF